MILTSPPVDGYVGQGENARMFLNRNLINLGTG